MKKIFLAVLFICLFSNGLKAQKVMIENLKGEQENFEDIISGDTPVIVSFWATWCKPCTMEMEALKELTPEWKDKVRIVSVSIDDSRTKGKVVSFVKGKNYPFEIYLDPNRTLYKKLNVIAVPFTFIFYKGEEVYKHSGYNPGDEDELIDEALELLKKN